MVTFKHDYAAWSKVGWVKEPDGSYRSDALVIGAKIPLDPAAPDFDERAVEALEAASFDYARGRGDPYRSIIFVDASNAPGS